MLLSFYLLFLLQKNSRKGLLKIKAAGNWERGTVTLKVVCSSCIGSDTYSWSNSSLPRHDHRVHRKHMSPGFMS